MHGIAATVAGTGTRSLDGAILGLPPASGAIGPRIYVSGPDTGPAMVLGNLGLDLRVCAGGIGAASALKMSYAGLNKGIMALASPVMFGTERAGAAEALMAELSESQPALLARIGRPVPDRLPKAYRWVAEMHEIAGFLAPDAVGGHVFEGTAQIFARLSSPDGTDEVPS